MGWVWGGRLQQNNVFKPLNRQPRFPRPPAPQSFFPNQACLGVLTVKKEKSVRVAGVSRGTGSPRTEEPVPPGLRGPFLPQLLLETVRTTISLRFHQFSAETVHSRPISSTRSLRQPLGTIFQDLASKNRQSGVS